MKIDGKQLASEILENLKQKIRNAQCANAQMTPPTMTVILVGDNPASLSYIKQKQLSAEKIGAKVLLKQFPEAISKKFLQSQISILNSDPSIHGIIIQRPLPSQIDKNTFNESIIPSKDIDGFHPQSKFLSPVGLAVLHVLKQCHPEYTRLAEADKQKQVSGSKLVISNKQLVNWLLSQKILLLGRGETGGKPIAKTMDKFKIKYTQSHSKTPNLKQLLKSADIIISAVGKPNLITGNMIKKGAICIGVGISRSSVIAIGVETTRSSVIAIGVETTRPSVIARSKATKQSTNTPNNNLAMKQFNNETMNKLVGDFDEVSIAPKSSYYTPTPGGIGPLTVAFLLSNLLEMYSNNK